MKTRMLRSMLAGLVVLGSLLSGPGVVPAGEAAPAGGAATITVTTTDDQWDSDVNNQGAGSGCSLREALDMALDSGDRGCGVTPVGVNEFTIKFQSGGTYFLTNPDALPDIGVDTIININDANVKIDGLKAYSRNTGIFHVVGGVLNLTGVTLQYGARPFGGAIWLSNGTVTADNVKFLYNGRMQNPNATTEGGAIHVDTGTLTVLNSKFQGNEAFFAGGAVSTKFGLFINTVFLSNKAPSGGALYVQTFTTDPVEVFDSEFKQNEAVWTGGVYTPENDPNGGGAIRNNGNLRVVLTLVEGNKTTKNKGGAGLWNEAGAKAVLEDCVFTDNQAQPGSGVLTWGGAIFNQGNLDLIRCSIHKNSANFAGAIFNRNPGVLNSYNSTISNNTALNHHGGLVNEHGLFTTLNYGAVMNLYHTTVAGNHSSIGDPVINNRLFAEQNYSIWLSNSIIDTACAFTQYTYGRSVIAGPCVTQIDPQHGYITSTDLISTGVAPIGLQSLTAGSANVPKFMVLPLGASNAIDIGRDDVYGCSNPLIARKDQNLAGRDAFCDAGAFEAGSQPPQYQSNNTSGVIQFPPVDLTQSGLPTFYDLILQNTGGGAMTYEVVDEGGAENVISMEGAGAGNIFGGQQVVLRFWCAPTAPGDYWKDIVIETNAPNKKAAQFGLLCVGSGPDAQASLVPREGPLNTDSTPPGQATTTSAEVTNHGQQPLNGSYGFEQSDPAWSATPTSQALAPSGSAFSLNPGETLSVDLSCTPPAPGVYVNRFIITTNDPSRPEIAYDLGCEGLVLSPPETLQPANFYATGSAEMVGIAVSPDGTTVLAGAADDHLLRVYIRDAVTGALSLFASPGSAALSEIYDVKFSHDGENVYYTSNAGDGIVVMERNGVLLQQTQVITHGTQFICGINPIQFCPFNAMDGARAVAVSPDDQYVYVGGFTDHTLTVFRRNLNNGQLSRVQTLTRTVDGLNVLGAAQRIAISPDNAHIYVAAQSDGLSVFQRGADGRLSLQAVYSDAMPGLSNFTLPADVVVSPDGNFVYATAWWDNALHIFRRSPADGKLTLVDVVPGLQAPYGLAITQEPEGERLFMGDLFGDGVRVYARDAVSGTLSVVGTFTDTPSSNIDSPFYLALSPDNMHLYVSLGIGQGVRLFQTIRHAPVVTHISPASAVQGGAAFTLIVRGGRFYPGSQIYWNGAPVTTQFINENELRAGISAGSIASAGPVDVWVRTPPTGGGDSPARTFLVQTPAAPPIPSIASVEPPEAEFGEGFGLSVTIYGANFAPASQVSYNGTPVPTNFINSETLQVSLGADVLAAPGTGGFTVTNGGGSAALGPEGSGWAQGGSTTSAVVAFKVTPPGEAPLPSLTNVAPGSVLSGSQGLWLTVLGYNFSDDAQAPSVGRWNGQSRPTVVMDPNELVMFVTTEDLHTGGTFAITVLTPGGGESEPLAFKVLLPGEKPVPVLDNYFLGPGVNATLYANGSDFDPGAQIYINGIARATTYANPTQVRTVLTAADTSGVVQVVNPGPGGGGSQALLFALRRVFLPILMR